MKNKYSRQLEEGKILAMLPSFRALNNETRKELKSFFKTHAPSLVSLSWGKQSVVIAHMTHEIAPEVECRFMMEPGFEEIADFPAVREKFLAKWPLSYTEEMGDHRLKTRAAAYRRKKGIAGTILGLTAEESRARRMTTARGWLRWKDGTWRCTPLRKWTWRDIAAYHAAHDIPCLSTYKTFGFEARTACGLGGHAEVGRDFLPQKNLRNYDAKCPPNR